MKERIYIGSLTRKLAERLGQKCVGLKTSWSQGERIVKTK